MLSEGARLIEAWAKGSYVGIDVTERKHAQMRQELRSEKRARNFTRSANHVALQDLRASHISRQGRDPAKVDVSSTQGMACVTAESQPHGNPQTSRNTGSNPYLAFRNSKVSARKQVIAPDRPLTALEMGEI